MLSRKTLLIIGAGAGFDIEMPLGVELARRIAGHLNIRFDEWGQRKVTGNDLTLAALRLLARNDQPRADVNPYCYAGRQIHDGLLGWSQSIDGYLNRHQDQPLIQQCGKLAIAQVILESEAECHLYIDLRDSDRLEFRDTERVFQSWFQALWSILEADIIRSKNLSNIFDNLSVITFNYDRTFEHFFHVGLQRGYHLSGSDAAAIINEKLDIDHVYGQVGYLPWQGKGNGFPFGRKPEAQHLANLWSRITTFNEEISDKVLLNRIMKKVSEAERIVFLGCHFHDQNMKLLRSAVTTENDVVIYGTAVGRSSSAISQIKQQVIETISPRGGPSALNIGHWDCIGLFKEFDTTWARA